MILPLAVSFAMPSSYFKLNLRTVINSIIPGIAINTPVKPRMINPTTIVYIPLNISNYYYVKIYKIIITVGIY